jgi:hypothetical protein
MREKRSITSASRYVTSSDWTRKSHPKPLESKKVLFSLSRSLALSSEQANDTPLTLWSEQLKKRGAMGGKPEHQKQLASERTERM